MKRIRRIQPIWGIAVVAGLVMGVAARKAGILAAAWIALMTAVFIGLILGGLYQAIRDGTRNRVPQAQAHQGTDRSDAGAEKSHSGSPRTAIPLQQRLHSQALAVLHGDYAALERLMEWERLHHPGATELEILRFVIASLDHDRRGFQSKMGRRE